MTRRAIAGALLATLALGAAWLLWSALLRDPERLPNVLLVTVDTLRADHLHAYGFPLENSPSVDRLAAQGMLFERMIATAGTTAPSHASIMTSRFVRSHSIGHKNGSTRLESEVTLASRFRDAGYETAAFVSNSMIRRQTGLDQGFDLYDDDLPAPELHRKEFFERVAELTGQRALAWIGRPHERPFFLWVHFQDPHGPYTPPQDYQDRFRVAPRGDERELRLLTRDSGYQGIPSYQYLEGLRYLHQYRTRYAGEVFYADLWIGKLVDALDAAARPNVVLFTADHGEAMGGNDRYFVHAFSTSPDVARVPLVLRAPGVPTGSRSQFASGVDVLPTLLELAGLPVPGDAQGLALGPYLRSGEPIPERLVFCDTGEELSAYWGDRFITVRRLPDVWAGPDARPRNTVWTSYLWQDGWQWPEAELERGRIEPIRSYFSEIVPMKDAPAFSSEDVERLRSLGYLNP